MKKKQQQKIQFIKLSFIRICIYIKTKYIFAIYYLYYLAQKKFVFSFWWVNYLYF